MDLGPLIPIVITVVIHSDRDRYISGLVCRWQAYVDTTSPALVEGRSFFPRMDSKPQARPTYSGYLSNGRRASAAQLRSSEFPRQTLKSKIKALGNNKGTRGHEPFESEELHSFESSDSNAG